MTYAKGMRADKSREGLRMYQDNILVLFDYIRDAREDDVTAGGIIKPKTATKPEKHQAAWATVVMVGPGAHITEYSDHFGSKRAESAVFHEPECKAGDRVLVDMAAQGQAVTIDGLEHRIVRFHNVLAVEESDAEAAE